LRLNKTKNENNGSMAGRGSPSPSYINHSKPLIPIAGKPIVPISEDIAKILNEPIEEVAFILGDPAGDDLVKSLENWQKVWGKASIYRQLEPLGTGHAIMCAKDSLGRQ
jgi:glucose-1-phosphate thymidylyltransferase